MDLLRPKTVSTFADICTRGSVHAYTRNVSEIVALAELPFRSIQISIASEMASRFESSSIGAEGAKARLRLSKTCDVVILAKRWQEMVSGVLAHESKACGVETGRPRGAGTEHHILDAVG